MPAITFPTAIARRSLLVSGLAAAAGAVLPLRAVRGGSGDWLRLVPRPGLARFFGEGGPQTQTWCYNGAVPGPEIRLRQGERLRVLVENELPQDTTVHWHGLRLPNAMDGVPDLTQPPIPPGAAFAYEFDLPDAGTFWYHPHVRSTEQQGRGLYGVLVVEEVAPPVVDREAVWVVDDWRLTEDGAIAEPFDHPHDLSHDGRLGNVATLNGLDSGEFAVRAGERLRLRIVNTANARVFALRFEGHRPVVIAFDGQPVQPHEPPEDRLVVPPAGRVDVILDMEGEPGGRYAVMDDFYARRSYRYLDLVYDQAAPLRRSPLDAPVALAPNPIPEPQLAEAARHEMVLAGGAMGSLRSAILDGKSLDLRALAGRGKVWAVNGVAAHGHVMEPLFTFQLGRTQLVSIGNDTAFPHPMHLHGHSFRLLTRNGRPVPGTPWLDTVLL
ncbi:MAG: multicopper oxidase family protein, partial [Kiloniellales bacterium]|nr:multicopper oxidase family protein [Kiloniellales bacterium]